MKGPNTSLLTALLAVLTCTWTASAALEVSEDDALSRLLRRPAGSGWVTGDAYSPLWIRDVDQTLPIGVIGHVHSAPITDRIDLTRTTIGIATTGSFIGRPDDTLGITATFATDPESIRFPASVAEEEEISFGVHHGWKLGTDVQLRSSFGWRTGPALPEPTVWAGLGIHFDF
ncbi:MAG: hypothetical protein CMJ67_01535 [Planctomycetaceae bacterium]|nr:hypothetical protein [Planctomycetaceae bacterium]